MLFERFDGLGGWEDEQCDLAPFSFAFHIIHHRQATRSGADNQTPAFPRNLLFDRNRRVPELIAEFLRRLLLTLTHVPAVDHHVVFIDHAVDSDGTEGELLEAHIYSSQISMSRVIEQELEKSGVNFANKSERCVFARLCVFLPAGFPKIPWASLIGSAVDPTFLQAFYVVRCRQR